MNKSYSGKLTVNEFLYPKVTDQNFLTFTGLDMNDPVSKAIFTEDIPAVNSAVDKLISGECNEYVIALRLLRADGERVWETVKLSLENSDYLGEKLILAKLSDPEAGITLGDELESEREIYESFLDMLHGILLRCNLKEDLFEIFYITGQRKNHIYKGTLENWEKNVKDNLLDEEYKSEFDDLCADIRIGKKDFRHTVKIAGVISRDKTEICAFRCHTIRKDGEGDTNGVVLGCIQVENQTKLKVVFLDSINDKDNSLDMLNKRAAIEYTNKIISRGDLKCSYFVILDLDNFKHVNDTFGHMTGDEVLVKTAKIINENVGSRGIVGRMGGDEILIVTDSIEEQTELRNMLRSIRTTVEWTFRNDPRELGVTCSMGVAAYPQNGKSFKEVFELADKMLYLAKEKGKNRYVIYTPEIHDRQLFRKDREDEKHIKKAGAHEDKLTVMHHMLENYLLKHSYNNELFFSEVGESYDLDEILIVYDNFTVVFRWTPDGVLSDIDKTKFFIPDKTFESLFDKDNLLVLDGLYKLGGRCRDVEEFLEKREIKSAMFYNIVRRGRMSGYMMFAKKNQRQKWSDYEIFALSLTAKVFDLSTSDGIN